MNGLSPVRPTRECLKDILAPIPDLGTRLSDLEHPLVMKAQQIPAVIEAGSADRIRALTDRIWFKVKTSAWRGAVGDVGAEAPSGLQQFHANWWVCAGGTRQADSPQSDFYSKLSERAHGAGPNSCSTDFLLPGDWDYRRLMAEAAVFASHQVSELILAAAAQSLLHSDIRMFMVGDRDVRVRITVRPDGDAYVAIGSTGSVDATFFITLMSAFPGVPPNEWLPEPDGGLAIEPEPGEIVWSAMLPPEVQALLAERASLD